MNTFQRLLSNTVLYYMGTLAMKASTSLLFIMIGRQLGPEDAGTYNLGLTYFTILLTMSALGLTELLIREVVPNRNESKRFLVNYLGIRTFLTVIAYSLLILFLHLTTPYSEQTTKIILIISLTILPEGIFSLCQALFVAFENVRIPVIASFVSSTIKIIVGLALLEYTANIIYVALMIPISTTLSLIVFIPALKKLFKTTPQTVSSRLSYSFSLNQLRYTPSFILISIFSIIDFQADTFLISILLDETRLGWYGAAQTIMLGFWMMPIAIRTAIYPIMARYHHQDYGKLRHLYEKVNRYLFIFALPIGIIVTILAKPIILLIFTEEFLPAVPALQIMIWSVVFAFLDVPNARLMLLYNKQKHTGWITGLSMITNLSLNIILIPVYGIVGAAIARTSSSFIFFLVIYVYTQSNFIQSSIFPILIRPLIAAIFMTITMLALKEAGLYWPIIIGGLVYLIAILLLKVIPTEDRQLFSYEIKSFFNSLLKSSH